MKIGKLVHDKTRPHIVGLVSSVGRVKVVIQRENTDVKAFILKKNVGRGRPPSKTQLERLAEMSKTAQANHARRRLAKQATAAKQNAPITPDMLAAVRIERNCGLREAWDFIMQSRRSQAERPQ